MIVPITLDTDAPRIGHPSANALVFPVCHTQNLISRRPGVRWTLARGGPTHEIKVTSDTSAHFPAPTPDPATHIECEAAP